MTVTNPPLAPWQIEHIRKMQEELGLPQSAPDTEEVTMDEEIEPGLAAGSAAAEEEEEETGALPYAAVRTAMTARKEAAKERKAYYEDLAAKLAARQAGPSFSERMFQLAAAFTAPTSTRGFSGVMGNVMPVLQAQAQAKREGEIKRQDALNALAAAQLTQREALAEQAVDTELELAKLNRPKPARVVGNTIINGVPSVIKQDADGNITTEPLGGGRTSGAATTGKTETRGGVVGYYDESGVWKPLPQRPVQETFRAATPEEAAMYGAKTGQISNLTGKFLPGAAPKPRELKPKEIQMLTDAEQAIASAEQAVRDFNRALELNPTVYSGGLATTRAAIGSVTSSSDPAYLATDEFANLTTQNALNALKTTFGSNPTEGERKILLEVQGSISKPPAVRERILRRAMGVAQRVIERNKAMIPKIQGGYYSTRTDGSQGKSAAKPRVINWNN